MRHWTGFFCLALMLASAGARGDILPRPDAGPPAGSAAGLDFAIQPIAVRMHGYSKMEPLVVLTGCTEGTPNCALARARHLIGMAVSAADNRPLQPSHGMVRQILDAFAAAGPVSLDLYTPGSSVEPVKVSFAGR